MSDDGNNVGDNAIFDSSQEETLLHNTENALLQKLLSASASQKRHKVLELLRNLHAANTKLANSMPSCRKTLIGLLFKLASKNDDATCAKLATQCLTTRLLEHKPDTFKRIVDDASSVLSKCVAAVHTRSPSEVLPDVQGMLGMLAVLTLVS